jgi:elongation factor G
MRPETITFSAEATYTHKKVLDGGGEFAKVTLRLEPLPRGGGLEFVNAALSIAIPINFIEGVEEGIKRAAEAM